MTLSWNDRALRVLVILVLAAGATVAAVLTAPDRAPSRRVEGTASAVPDGRIVASRGSADEITIALTGDAVLLDTLPFDDPGMRSVAALLSHASTAVTNFELTALAALSRRSPQAKAEPQHADEVRWPAASPSAAADLRGLGINLVSLANNHVHDYGAEGMRETERLLEEAGIVHAGTGNNLAEARAPATIDTPAGRVAFISIATSHAPLARAAPARGEIGGRPGLNPLRYTKRVTVDAAAFAALRNSFVRNGFAEGASEPADGASQNYTWGPPCRGPQCGSRPGVALGGPQPAKPGGRHSATHSEDQLTLFGTVVNRGERPAVELVEDATDVEELLEAIRRARKTAASVIVAIHAHEPSNLVDEVPSFLRRVAHQAIDAGADIIVGHGPHRLRGIEMYNKRPILYSLGNFIFHDRALQPEAADIFENATQTMLAGIAEPVEARRPVLDYDDDVWWESVVARATFRDGELVRLELYPIDLGIGQLKETRGTPRLASPAAAARILARMQRLSAPFGTAHQIRSGVAVITH